ncbi:MAG: RNA 2',3'-cyclic phosphodiesterase [candidate division KSB1 bacterium]|jgi:2'-5' RNA ligase|nr:RNA 2',3'-cyclic phosphodiesterase [candidate division KSB1 bacterium]
MNKIRTFIAIEIPPHIKKEISEFQRHLMVRDTRISWPKPDNIHITLKFVGDVETNAITAITEAVEKGVEQIPPFNVKIVGVGTFPSGRKPRILWIGAKSENSLMVKCADNIDQKLEELGYEKETRPFRAHLTLGRVKSQFKIDEVLDRLNESRDFECDDFLASEIIVVQSTLHASGAIYTPLKRIRL